MNAQLLKFMRHYREYHTKKWTIYTHFVGIPLVTFSVLLVLGWFRLSMPGVFTISFAWLVLIAFSVYYIWLDRIFGLATAALLLVLTLIAHFFTLNGPTALSIKLFFITFVFGWILQLLGHAIEGKKPALFDSFFESVVVAPIFIVAEVLAMFSIHDEWLSLVEQSEEVTQESDGEQ